MVKTFKVIRVSPRPLATIVGHPTQRETVLTVAEFLDRCQFHDRRLAAGSFQLASGWAPNRPDRPGESTKPALQKLPDLVVRCAANLAQTGRSAAS